MRSSWDERFGLRGHEKSNRLFQKEPVSAKIVFKTNHKIMKIELKWVPVAPFGLIFGQNWSQCTQMDPDLVPLLLSRSRSPQSPGPHCHPRPPRPHHTTHPAPQLASCEVLSLHATRLSEYCRWQKSCTTYQNVSSTPLYTALNIGRKCGERFGVCSIPEILHHLMIFPVTNAGSATYQY